jgi:hypothetical protein
VRTAHMNLLVKDICTNSPLPVILGGSLTADDLDLIRELNHTCIMIETRKVCLIRDEYLNSTSILEAIAFEKDWNDKRFKDLQDRIRPYQQRSEQLLNRVKEKQETF